MTLSSLAVRLQAEAECANERRVLVLTGSPESTRRAAVDAIRAADFAIPNCTAVSAAEDWPFERVGPRQSRELLGRTQQAIVVDGHDECSANALGRTVGAVDSGGLYILLAPALDAWAGCRDEFDETLAVPPFGIEDVTGHFRERLVGTLWDHPGIAICGVPPAYDGQEDDAVQIHDDGCTDPWPARPSESPEVPDGARFSDDIYHACKTADQAEAVHELEALQRGSGNSAVVVEADRGRGKSSAAGLTAGALARAGEDVLVAAPERRGADELFARARERLAATDGLSSSDANVLAAESGGRVRFVRPPEAAELPEQPDAVIVDEAAALPVSLLERFLEGPPVAFCTTVHGYEGAGRSFDVRFRGSLADSERSVVDVRLNEPIRYAAGDPVESWAFRALLLDARPPVAQLVAGAAPETVNYEELTPERLLGDEHLLREAFGLLVLAHYRTQPDDLVRLLDAPNLTCRALLYEDRVVSIALLAREGGLSDETRERAYRGERVRGNMLPDLFTSQLRDRKGGEPVGYRVMRIATHHAVRSNGLGSRLLGAVEDEFRKNDRRDADLRDERIAHTGRQSAGERIAHTGRQSAGERIDYLGVGYGATPKLLDFWQSNGYQTVHLSKTKNDASGEHSALMVRPLTDAGTDLAARHAQWFRERVPGVLTGPLDSLAPDVVRRTLRAVADDAVPENPGLSERDWRVIIDTINGVGSYHTAPAAFSELALRELILGAAGLDPAAERLLVEKALQNREWDAVAEDLDRVSARMTMRAFGNAYEPLVETYGTDAAKAHREYWEN